MNVQSILSDVFIRYALAQATLLPLMLFSWFVIPKRASLRFQWAFHRVLVVAALVLPILLSLPGASMIAHSVGDLAVRTPAVVPAPEPAAAAAQPDSPTLFSPPLPSGAPPSRSHKS
jgi:hypothetical protein